MKAFMRRLRRRGGAAPVSLKMRLTLALSIIAILTAIPASVAIHFFVGQAMEREVDKSLVESTHRFTNPSSRSRSSLCDPDHQNDNGRSRGRWGHAGHGVANQCYDRELKPIGPETVEGFPRPPHLVQEGQTEGPLTVNALGNSFRVLRLGMPDGNTIQVFRDTDEVVSAQRKLIPMIVATTISIVVLASLAGWLVTRKDMFDLRQLEDLVRRIAKRGHPDGTECFQPRSKGEVRLLGNAFMEMLHALQRSQEQQHQLVRDIGHDIRTPLTSIRTNIATLRRHPDVTDSMRGRILDDLDGESAELSRLLSEVVSLTTDEYAEGEIDDVDLFVVAERAAATALRRSGREVRVLGRRRVISCHANNVLRVFNNLIDNAMKYSPPEKPVEVHFLESQIRVRDFGPGVIQVDQERVFDRFYRSDAARSTPGSGLGLAITKKIVESCGGRIWVEEAPGGGADFVIELPDPQTPPPPKGNTQENR